MPPRLNLIVRRSARLDDAARFYERLGLDFTKHAHGKGPEHYASEDSGVVFEIYPQIPDGESTLGTRIGFSVESVDEAYERLIAAGGRSRSEPRDGPWGRRAVLEDLDGHVVELTSPLGG